MPSISLKTLSAHILNDPLNQAFKARGWRPVYTAHEAAQILIVGQAPGIRAQESGIPWNDQSGNNLRAWLGIDRDTFYDERRLALVPMDFFYPGSRERGDNPPRPEFATKWHPLILSLLPHIRLTILIGQYAQAYYLGNKRKTTLTETVRAFDEYLPKFFPLVHPSPRNNIWQKKNPWFQKTVLPALRQITHQTLH